MSDNSLRPRSESCPDLLSTYGDQADGHRRGAPGPASAGSRRRPSRRTQRPPIPTSGDIYSDRWRRGPASGSPRSVCAATAVCTARWATARSSSRSAPATRILGHEFINDLGQRRARPRPARRGLGTRRGRAVRRRRARRHRPAPRPAAADRVREPPGRHPPRPHRASVAQVRLGKGNGAGNGAEGASNDTVFGTYMHGPVLARNPQITNMLLKLALGERAAADRRPLVRGAPGRAHLPQRSSPPERSANNGQTVRDVHRARSRDTSSAP